MLQDKLVSVSTVKEGGGVYVYKVHCTALGETEVTLRSVVYLSIYIYLSIYLYTSLIMIYLISR